MSQKQNKTSFWEFFWYEFWTGRFWLLWFICAAVLHLFLKDSVLLSVIMGFVTMYGAMFVRYTLDSAKDIRKKH